MELLNLILPPLLFGSRAYSVDGIFVFCEPFSFSGRVEENIRVQVVHIVIGKIGI